MISSFAGVQLVVIIFVFTPFASFALFLRLWSRRIMNSHLTFSDYTAILALILTIGENTLCLIEAFIGISGVHVSEILATNPSLLPTYLKLATPGIVLWGAANTCVKLSILSLYTTLFPNPKFQKVSYGTMVVSATFFIYVFLTAFVTCTPVQFNWDKSIPGGTCGQSVPFLVSGILNVVIDAFIVALPMPMLFNLQLSLYKKFSVAVMFSLGGVICIISLFRVISLHRWSQQDVTFGSAQISMFSTVEPTLGVVNACLPTIKPALYRICRKCGYYVSRTQHKGTGKPGLEDNGRQNRMMAGIQYSPSHHFEDHIPLTIMQSDNEVSGTSERETTHPH
ncbi:hypothetical protein F4678DRAFT_425557 [Xylaria arbuscula]|nr:hypothetical protein F4678DRAFT_425557 [Xylaria arbuscula]